MDNKGDMPKYERITKLIVRSLVILSLVGFLIYKLWDIKIVITNFDFLYFLSTVLAIFAIVLSVMFYFKSTDQSNQFYNSTFSFTKDISVLLAKIESGFGERLKNIEEEYRDKGRDKNKEIKKEEQNTTEKLTEESKQLEEKQISIESYLQKKLSEKGITSEEIQLINSELKKKNEEYARSISEVESLKNQLSKLNYQKKTNIEYKVIDFLLSRLRSEKGLTKDDVKLLSRNILAKLLNIIANNARGDFLRDAIESKIIDKNRNITKNGFERIQEYISENY
jgi:hypothetical protein